MNKLKSTAHITLLIISLIAGIVMLVEIFNLLSNVNDVNIKIFAAAVVVQQVSLYFARKIDKSNTNIHIGVNQNINQTFKS